MFPVTHRGRRLLLFACALLLCGAGGAAVRFGAAPTPWAPPAPQGAAGPDLPLHSRALVVIDAGTGRILVGRGAYAKLPPGPLLLMLTALTAVAGRPEDELVLISRQAAVQPGVRLGLVRGSEVPLGALVRAVWFTGAADAGVALAEHAAGSPAAFVRQMNERARAVGALETTALDALGADRPGQRSTAYDLALIARAALQEPLLRAVAAERRAAVAWDGGARELLHVNPFLWAYAGATGLKSGYSEEAGHVAAAAARRGARELVAVVLGAPSGPSRLADLTAHLDYAFRNYAALAERPWADALPYDVRPGDTLSQIAAASGVPPDRILAWNALEDPDRLTAGTRLWLPTEQAGAAAPAR